MQEMTNLYGGTSDDLLEGGVVSTTLFGGQGNDNLRGKTVMTICMGKRASARWWGG